MNTKNNQSKEINKRYALVLNTLERLEKRQYSGLDVHWCANSIDWLWKWKKITVEEKDLLCKRVIALC